MTSTSFLLRGWLCKNKTLPPRDKTIWGKKRAKSWPQLCSRERCHFINHEHGKKGSSDPPMNSIFWSLASALKTTGYSMVTLAKTGFTCPYQAGFCSSSLLQSNSDFNKRHKQRTKNHVVDVVLCETKMFSIVVWPMKVRGEYSILVI